MKNWTQNDSYFLHLTSNILHIMIRMATSNIFLLPSYIFSLWGDPTKAKAKLKWNPSKTSFEELVRLMVESDIAKVASEGAAAKVRTNLAEYLEKGIVK